MPISINSDFNNIPVVLETKLPIYLFLLECIIRITYPSLNCPTENTFALQMLDLISLGWWEGERVQMAYYCDNTLLSLYHTSKASGTWLPQICLNPSYATVEGSLPNFHFLVYELRVWMPVMEGCREDCRYSIMWLGRPHRLCAKCPILPQTENSHSQYVDRCVCPCPGTTVFMGLEI